MAVENKIENRKKKIVNRPLLTFNTLLENRKNKINYGRKDFILYLVFDFFLPIGNFAYFIYSLYESYYEDHTTFVVSIVFGAVIPYLISWGSFYAIWEADRKKLTDWGQTKCNHTLLVSRWVFHIILPLPSIPRGFDILLLKRKCAAEKADDDKFKRLFQDLLTASKKFTFLEHLGSCYEQAPQLVFSLHQICLVILSGKNLLYYILNDGGRKVVEALSSIASCAWKLVSNRTNLNLSNDKEKEMTKWHIIFFLTSHLFILFGCFTTRAMLTAYSAPGFGILYAVHVLLVFITLCLYFFKVENILSNWKESQLSRWNIVKRALTIAIVVLCSSPFSLVDYRLEEVDVHDGIYYAIPFFESVFLYFLAFLSTPYKYLYVSSMAAYIVGLISLCLCSTSFRLDVIGGSSTPSSSNSIWNKLLIRLTWKWKNMDELLRDGDLSDKEKDAIRRKDVNWICKHMKNNLIHVLNLVLAENGATLNKNGSPINELCSNYTKEDLPQILKLLIKKGAKVDYYDDCSWYKSRTLNIVCGSYPHRNLKDIVDLLIKAKVPVDVTRYYHRTALHYLAENYKHDDMIDIIDQLIKAGVPVDATDGYGNTLLHLIAQYYKHDNMKGIVDLLIKAKVPVDTKNNFGDTALHLLIKWYDHANMKDVVDLLIQNGVPADAKNKNQDTALHHLAYYYKHDNMKDIVELLINAKVPVDAKNKNGDTALHLLAANNNMKEMETKNWVGRVARFLFARYYKKDPLEETVRLLTIDKKDRLNVQNLYGLTPLMKLCRNKNKLKHIRVFSMLTPVASEDPLRSDTEKVTDLLKKYGEKINDKDLCDGLEKIFVEVVKDYRKKK